MLTYRAVLSLIFLTAPLVACGTAPGPGPASPVPAVNTHTPTNNPPTPEPAIDSTALPTSTPRATPTHSPADSYIEQGNEYVLGKDFDSAIAAFTKAIERDAGSARAYTGRGGVYLINGNLTPAMADFNKAISLQPDFAYAYVERGYLYIVRLQDYAHGLTDVDRAISLDSHFAWAYYVRAAGYEQRMKNESARFRKTDQGFAIADLTTFIEDAGVDLSITPDQLVNAYDERANLYSQADQDDLAIKDYTNALKIQEDSYAYYWRAVLYAGQGERAKATADFNKVIQLNQTPDWVIRARRELQKLNGK